MFTLALSNGNVPTEHFFNCSLKNCQLEIAIKHVVDLKLKPNIYFKKQAINESYRTTDTAWTQFTVTSQHTNDTMIMIRHHSYHEGKNMSALYGAIDDLLEFSIYPAVLNIDSTGTLPGLIARYILAIWDRIGKSLDFWRQKSIAVSFSFTSADKNFSDNSDFPTA